MNKIELENYICMQKNNINICTCNLDSENEYQCNGYACGTIECKKFCKKDIEFKSSIKRNKKIDQ